MLKTVTGRTTLPVVSVYSDSELYTGLIGVAVVAEMPLNGAGCILANDVMQNSTCKSELPCLQDVLPREKAWIMYIHVS